jgi:DNA invertase Pin-like site-specific DNA recombinase
MFDGIDLIKRIHDRGALIKVLEKPHLDLTTPIGRGFIAFLSATAEDERHRIMKRANEGRAAAIKYQAPPHPQSSTTTSGRRRLSASRTARAAARSPRPSMFTAPQSPG